MLNDQKAQSLAGRVRILEVLPLAFDELTLIDRSKDISEAIYNGLYPRIYNQKLNPSEWLSDYLQTYVQKDVRQISQIENLMLFDRLLRLVAGRVDPLINYSSLASEVGVSVPTIKHWISILQASFILYELWPHHKNFNKRIIKSPKIYFYDTGLASLLLRITNTQQMDTHPLRGSLFENWVINEKMKKYTNEGKKSPYYFWRDQHGHEVDLVKDTDDQLDLIEIKSSATFHADFCDGINWPGNLQTKKMEKFIMVEMKRFISKVMKLFRGTKFRVLERNERLILIIRYRLIALRQEF